MSINKGKCGFNNLLKSLTSIGNFEQNSSYPPFIFEGQVNAVTSILLSKLCEQYPTSQGHHDMIEPFIVFKKCNVTDGYIDLPEEYRGLLGNPSIVIKPNGKECELPDVKNENEFKTLVLKSKAKTRPLVIVPRSEWDEKTTSSYDFPTYENPIGQFVGSRRIQILPYDLSVVYVMFAKKENTYRFGYIQQPDDTYLFDGKTTEDTEWGSAAFVPIFNALVALYSAYSRDPDLRDWSVLLKNGIL